MRSAVAGLIALACALSVGRAAPASADEVAPLRAAVAAHPDDPDLLRALARALARDGHPAEAAARLTDLESRWAGRYPDLWLEIGRLRHEAGDDAGALAAFERAHPSGTVHFWRGLLLRRLGRRPEAERALVVAARLEPALRAEVALVRGLDRLAAGDSVAARELLEEAVAHDRTGAIARTVQAALPPDLPRPRFASLFASAGFEHDSNVTLDSGTSPLASREADARTVLGAGVLLRPVRGETTSLVVGYRFQSAIQDDLEEYDFDTHAVSGGSGWRAHERLALRVDGLYAASIRDDSPYLHTASGLPSAILTLGPRAGALRLFGELTRRDYDDEPLISSLERSGRTTGFGVTHFASLPLREGAWTALTARRAVTNTKAERDVLGFEGDYDGVRFEGVAAVFVPFPRGFATSVSLSLARDRYFQKNLVDALTDEEVGTATPRRRRDTLFESRVGMQRALSERVSLEVAWRYGQSLSNVDVYEYDRHVFGVYLKAEL